jgi:hypothetical protein
MRLITRCQRHHSELKRSLSFFIQRYQASADFIRGCLQGFKVSWFNAGSMTVARCNEVLKVKLKKSYVVI